MPAPPDIPVIAIVTGCFHSFHYLVIVPCFPSFSTINGGKNGGDYTIFYHYFIQCPNIFILWNKTIIAASKLLGAWDKSERVIKVNKTIALSMILLVLLMPLTGCKGNDTEIKSQDGDSTFRSEIVADALDENTTPSPEMHSSAVPAVFVNDTYFRVFDDRQHIVPDLDDTWIFLGSIQSSASGWESPTQNFQTNNELMIGAEIFHSFEGHVPITNSVWGDPLNDEVVGDSIIVVFEGARILYITEELHAEAYKVMGAVERHSLMVDGVIYSLMGSRSGGYILDSCVYLGEITSTVPIDEYPTENLQANRDIVVGMKVYRLPPGDINDIIVLFSDSYTSCYFYKSLMF